MPTFDNPQCAGIIAWDIQAVDRIATVGLRIAEGIDLAVDQRLDERAVGYVRAIQHDRAVKARRQRWKGQSWPDSQQADKPSQEQRDQGGFSFHGRVTRYRRVCYSYWAGGDSSSLPRHLPLVRTVAAWY
jgi:hypothetical protein